MSSFHQINLDEKQIVDYNSSFSLIMDISFAKEIFNFEPKQKIDSWLKNELKS